MNIGIDLDGTITARPEFFARLTKALTAGGCRVFVIPLRHRSNQAATEAELHELGIVFHKVICAHVGVDAPVWKSRWAKRVRLDAMFEDSPDNLNAMPNGVAKFLLK